MRDGTCWCNRPAARRWRGLTIAVAVIAVGAALSACKSSTVGTKAAYADDQPAGQLYNEGLANLNSGKFSDAITSFDEVDRQHPFTDFARKALVMSAFA